MTRIKELLSSAPCHGNELGAVATPIMSLETGQHVGDHWGGLEAVQNGLVLLLFEKETGSALGRSSNESPRTVVGIPT